MAETWKSVPNHPLYEASNLGRIRNAQTGLIRKFSALPKGYLTITLGHSTHRYVAHLIAETFIGPRPEGLEINHKDGDKANNTVENLEYVTHSENQRHAYRVLGTLKLNLPCGKGEKNTMAKLSDSDVIAIRRDCKNGIEQKETAKKYGVSQPQISVIFARKSWAHI